LISSSILQHSALRFTFENKMVAEWTIVTGASSNHFRSLLQCLKSLPKGQNIVIYDLGLAADEVAQIQQYGHVKILVYAELPRYFDIHRNAGEYAWKALIVRNEWAVCRTRFLVWLDAGCVTNGDFLESWRAILEREHFYSPVSSGTILDWMHKQCANALGVRINENVRNRSGGVLGFDRQYEPNGKLVYRWCRWAYNKTYIAPRGSSRDNHRQDQTLLSILVHQWQQMKLYTNELTDVLVGIDIHRDCDNTK